MIRRLFKKLLIVVAVLFIVAIAIASPTIYKGYQLYKNVTAETSISQKVSQIQSNENYVPLENISTNFTDGIIKSEDKRFRYHLGIDPIAITRALVNDIKAGSFVEGGSTITQQLAKNMYFDFEKTLTRKVAEVFVGFNLEKDYTKDQILELYCNCIYFGENCYGIKAAASHYYGASANQISDHQAASLVYTIKCPNYYNPNEIACVATL